MGQEGIKQRGGHRVTRRAPNLVVRKATSSLDNADQSGAGVAEGQGALQRVRNGAGYSGALLRRK